MALTRRFTVLKFSTENFSDLVDLIFRHIKAMYLSANGLKTELIKEYSTEIKTSISMK